MIAEELDQILTSGQIMHPRHSKWYTAYRLALMITGKLMYLFSQQQELKGRNCKKLQQENVNNVNKISYGEGYVLKF